MALLKGMPSNTSLRIALILFCGITVVILFFQRKIISRLGDNDMNDLSRKGTNFKFNRFPRKEAVDSLQSPGRKIFIAFGYWEQLTAATNNFLDLTALAAYGGRQVVVPFVKNSRLYGSATDKGFEALALYYNVSALNRTLRSRGHGTLISWKEFQDICQGKLDMVVRFDYTKLKRTTIYSQATRSFFPCNDSYTDTISTHIKVERTICVNVFAVKSDEKFENEVVKRLPCVGLDQWRGSNTESTYRAQFKLSPVVANRMHSGDAAIFFSSKLLHVARDFITKNLGQLFFSMHIRVEKILKVGRTIRDMAAVKECISRLTARVQSNKNVSTASVPVFLATDFANYGSSSLNANAVRENARSLMNILAPLKPVIFQPSAYNLTDRGTVAIVEMNILVSGARLFVVGGGTFQRWLVNQFLNKNNIDQRSEVKCKSKMCNNFCYF